MVGIAMKERIRELATGSVEVARPVVKMIPERLEGALELEGVQKSSFLVETENSVAVKGVIYSSHSRVTVMRPTFFGRSCEILFSVNTVGLSGHAVVDGTFTLVTNAGVFQVPFSYRMAEPVWGCNNRVVGSLEDYAALVAEDSEAAYGLFRSKAFMQLPILKNLDQIALYQTLRTDANTARCVEEFLASVGAKPSLVFSIAGDRVKTFSEVQEEMTGEVHLVKNTWGWGELRVSCSADYVVLSRQEIFASDFTDDQYVFTYQIRGELLAEGTNVCDIVFTTAKGSLIYKLCVAGKEAYRFSQRSGILRQRSAVRLMKTFLNYRILKDIEDSRAEKMLSQLASLLETLRSENPEEWRYTLLLVYAYLLQNRPEDADPLLDLVREPVMQNRLTDVRSYCFFLYVRSLFHESKEQMETTASLINKYYTEEGQDPALMLLLLNVDENLKNNQSLALLRLKECYKRGCRSPLLYLMACENYRQQPDLLRVLNSFELQVAFFGARHGMLTKEIAEEVARAASHEQQYRGFTYRLLHDIYKKYPTAEMLATLCSYLIRSNCTQKRFFPCYEAGVAQGLSIVSLNEYFMYSLPADYNKPLPQELLLYFTYSDNMKDDLQEVLYENVLLHYPEDSQVYREYRELMEEYALTKLLEGRISRKLVPLYQHLVVQEMIDVRLAKVLPNLLMAYEFVCNNRQMEKMVLRYPELNYEDVYPLEEGVCCAPLFTERCMVFFVDRFGCRYSDIPYTKEMLFGTAAQYAAKGAHVFVSGEGADMSALLSRCEEVYPEHFMFRLRRCRQLIHEQKLDVDDVALLQSMMDVADLHPLFRMKLISKLLDYNLSQEQVDGAWLQKLDILQMRYNERKKMLECMIRAGMYESAYDFVRTFGISGLRYDSLLRLLTHVIAAEKVPDDVGLCYLCLYLYSKTVYNSATLAYLCGYYDGPSATMMSILETAVEERVPVGDFPERILAQKLFSEDWEKLDALFGYYMKSDTPYELLTRAYEVVCSYRYFVLGETLEPWIFERLERALLEKSGTYPCADISKIALLFHYSQCEVLTQEQLSQCETILSQLCKKGLLFGFYSKLWQKVSCPAELNGKFLLEHRSHGAARVFLYSHFLGSSQEMQEQMQEMYSGIFVSQVVLFADETLEYSIVEEDAEGNQTEVVSKEILANDMSFVRQGSVFDTINSFSRYQATGQEKRLEEAMLERAAKQEMMRRLFGLM